MKNKNLKIYFKTKCLFHCVCAFFITLKRNNSEYSCSCGLSDQVEKDNGFCASC